MTRGRHSAVQAAYSALQRGILRTSNEVVLDNNGYVATASLNLLDGLDLSHFEADLRQGNGNELAGKFRAVHSSTALAVNSFGPFRQAPDALRLLGATGFRTLRFERKCPHGLGTTPPNLDVLVDAGDHVIGVESKCTEHLGNKTPDFKPAYDLRIRDERRDGPWFRMMKRLIDAPEIRRQLDAAQLVKHAFGLAHTFRDRPSTLLYVYWEPTNPDAYHDFARHRLEIEQFADQVSGGNPSFAAMSYPELWSTWDGHAEPSWLAQHLARVRQRYWIEM